MFTLMQHTLCLWIAGFLLVKMNRWLGGQNRAHHRWIEAGGGDLRDRLNRPGQSVGWGGIT